jgi:hypothetical protein
MNFINNLIEHTSTIRFAILDGLPPRPSARYIAQLERRLEFFRAHGVTPIIFVPHVTPNYDTRSCFHSALQTIDTKLHR